MTISQNCVVLGFSFGKPASIMPNRIIARRMEGVARMYSLPMVADRSVPIKISGTTYFIGPSAEIHVPTLLLAEQFATIAKEKKWDQVIIISEPQYLNRCERDLRETFKRMDLDCRIVIADIALQSGESWFDPKCQQWWTRRKWLFRPYEFTVQSLPFFFYKWLSYKEKIMQINNVSFIEKHPYYCIAIFFALLICDAGLFWVLKFIVPGVLSSILSAILFFIALSWFIRRSFKRPGDVQKQL